MLSMLTQLRALSATLTLLLFASFANGKTETLEQDEDLLVIELSGFEVFSKNIKVIDGLTGRDYERNHPVALGFRRAFDDILLRFHKKLLFDEYKNLKARGATIAPHISDLAALADSFGWEGFEVAGPHLTRETAIFQRMVKDPFFKIEKIVVWDARALAARGNILPDSKYARNLRLNESTGKWERRVMTKWDVYYLRQNPRNGKVNPFYTYKEQGLNLDTNRGFHLIEIGLPGDVPPQAFKEVGLDYPIVIDQAIDEEQEIESLKNDLVENLIYLYDPFSWAARGNTRFRGGFRKQIHQHIEKQRLNLSHRAWFDSLFSSFLNDIVTVNYWGADEIYEHQILSSTQKNRNQLGEDLDLLNWHKRERRSVNYDPQKPIQVPTIDFTSPNSARYIMLDAYRRYGDSFLEALRSRILKLETQADPRELILSAIEEVSGVSSEKYIPAAAKIQREELQRFVPKS